MMDVHYNLNQNDPGLVDWYVVGLGNHGTKPVRLFFLFISTHPEDWFQFSRTLNLGIRN